MHKDFRIIETMIAHCGHSYPSYRRGYPGAGFSLSWSLMNIPYCVKAKKGITLDDKHVNFPSFCPLEKPKD